MSGKINVLATISAHLLNSIRTGHIMDDRIQQLEERMARLQADLGQMSDEVYAQQKEISALVSQVKALTNRLALTQTDSGILASNEDTPPPHY